VEAMAKTMVMEANVPVGVESLVRGVLRESRRVNAVQVAAQLKAESTAVLGVVFSGGGSMGDDDGSGGDGKRDGGRSNCGGGSHLCGGKSCGGEHGGGDIGGGFNGGGGNGGGGNGGGDSDGGAGDGDGGGGHGGDGEGGGERRDWGGNAVEGGK